MIDKSIHRFWGKATADRFHPAVCHMVDTGLVIRELFAVQPDHFKARFAEEFGISDNDIHDLVAFIGALHDIGKIRLERRSPHVWG